jgi:nucleoside-diphosphate-sugar epimerase
MKAFVTGGAGFAGQHVVRKLIARGYHVAALAGDDEEATFLSGLGADVAIGRVTDMSSMRTPMLGSDAVFHLAERHQVGRVDWAEMEAVNIGGTRRVLKLALELGIPRIVYASSITIFGHTEGQLVDESYYQEGPFRTEYERTKWLAHYKVVLPLMEKGAPVILVVPGTVYGPGDDSIVADLMRLFYRGFPLIPGSDTEFTFTHVEDIAEGIILAAERGRIGESYVLAGPTIPLGEMVEFWSQLTGRPSAPIRVPSPVIRASASLAEALGGVTDLQSAFSREGAGLAGVTYKARSDKARQELGWQPRALQLGMVETFDWIAQTEERRGSTAMREREELVARIALLAAVALLLFWLFRRRSRT